MDKQDGLVPLGWLGIVAVSIALGVILAALCGLLVRVILWILPS